MAAMVLDAWERADEEHDAPVPLNRAKQGSAQAEPGAADRDCICV